MPKFAEFHDRPSEIVHETVQISPMVRADTESCARLAAVREDMGLNPWRDHFRRVLETPSQLVLVARLGGHVVGYGKATYLEPSQQGGHGAPDGWYLTGVVVDPTVRRRGVGRQLTQARLDVLGQRGIEQVWCFANARNTVSLELHRRLGFREITRDFAIAGVTFEGGEGVLSCWDNARWTSAGSAHRAVDRPAAGAGVGRGHRPTT